MIIQNILTFDLEDWYHGNFLFDEYGQHSHDQDRVERPTRQILMMLEQNNQKATFFVLGEVAEKFPDLIREIADQGHEVGSHCFEHRLVYNSTKDFFQKDIKKSKEVLEAIIGHPVIGFRAPYWSIKADTDWVWDILKQTGFQYDASLYPFKTYLYGDNLFPRFHHQISTSINGKIEEIPATTARFLKYRIPFCGGFYFRILPYRIVKSLTKKVNTKEDQPVVFYFHPYEIDPKKEKSSRGLRNNFILHVNVKKFEKKFSKLIKDHQFTSIKDYFSFD